MNKQKLQCAISTSSDFFCKSWSMIILREFMIFGGTRRFEQLHNSLGISRNILTKRLEQMSVWGLLKKSPITENGKRMEYKLRRKAWELIPVMLTLDQWARKWIDDSSKAELDYVDVFNGEPLAHAEVRSSTGRILQPGDVKVIFKTENAKNYLKKYKSNPKKKLKKT